MEAGDDDPQSVLTVVQASSGGAALLLVGSDGYSTSVAVGRRHVPESLRDMVEDGRIGRQRVMLAGEPVVAVGVPLPAVDATYVEFVPMSEIEGTLDRVRVGLVAAAMVMTLVGVLAGRVASDRVLHPVRRMSRAARSIGEGALDRRLDSEGDADLEPLVESFNDMVDGLQARIEREARFASDVSHELRSPLMTLQASIEVLENNRDALSERAQAALDLLAADLDRFRELVEDLLEISRFDAGAARLDLSEIRPGELATQSVAWSQNPDVPIQLDSDLAGVLIRADKRRLVRVISNLLDNARKYGGGATRIELRRLPEAMQIVVEDSGPGVPPEERDLIFDRFSRGAGSSRRSGSEGVGLGLSLVSEHVALHQGEVWVEDRPDGEPGARFVVELPVLWDELTETDTEAEEQEEETIS